MLTRRAARTREGAEIAPRFQNGLNGVLAPRAMTSWVESIRTSRLFLMACHRANMYLSCSL